MKAFLAILAYLALAVVAMLSCGCGDLWFPYRFPVDVYVDPQAEMFRNDVEIAAFTWNDAIGQDVFVVHPADDPIPREHLIAIVRGGSPAMATAVSSDTKCDIHTGWVNLQPDTFVHEMLHCLGYLHHDQEPDSIMNEWAAPAQKIEPWHVQFVLDMIASSSP